MASVVPMSADMSSNYSGPPSAGGPPDAQRNQRYVYLVARLHNRQMTMEEATELFGLMQVMLRQSEAARVALVRAAAAPPPTTLRERAVVEVAARPAGPTAASDDFFLLGILAMGAGAGLLAAMTKRLSDLAPPPPPPKPTRTGSGAASP